MAYEKQYGTLIDGLTLFGGRILTCMVYATGYQDETGKVRELLGSSKSLRGILAIEQSDEILDRMGCSLFTKRTPVLSLRYPLQESRQLHKSPAQLSEKQADETKINAV